MSAKSKTPFIRDSYWHKCSLTGLNNQSSPEGKERYFIPFPGFSPRTSGIEALV